MRWVDVPWADWTVDPRDHWSEEGRERAILKSLMPTCTHDQLPFPTYPLSIVSRPVCTHLRDSSLIFLAHLRTPVRSLRHTTTTYATYKYDTPYNSPSPSDCAALQCPHQLPYTTVSGDNNTDLRNKLAAHFSYLQQQHQRGIMGRIIAFKAPAYYSSSRSASPENDSSDSEIMSRPTCNSPQHYSTSQITLDRPSLKVCHIHCMRSSVLMGFLGQVSLL